MGHHPGAFEVEEEHQHCWATADRTQTWWPFRACALVASRHLYTTYHSSRSMVTEGYNFVGGNTTVISVTLVNQMFSLVDSSL